MFGTARKILGRLRGVRRAHVRRALRNDDAHLRSSQANKDRLDAAIAELNAGRGTAVNLNEVAAGLRARAGR